MKITGNRLVDNGDSITVIEESYRLLGAFLGAILGILIVLHTPFTGLIISIFFTSGEHHSELTASELDFYLVAVTSTLGMLLAQGQRERDVIKTRVVKVTRKYGEVTVVVASQDPLTLSAN